MTLVYYNYTIISVAIATESEKIMEKNLKHLKILKNNILFHQIKDTAVKMSGRGCAKLSEKQYYYFSGG